MKAVKRGHEKLGVFWDAKEGETGGVDGQLEKAE